MGGRIRNEGGVGRRERPRGGRGDLRLFVAAYPDRAWSERAIGALGTLELPAHRVTPVGQVHLTLCFLASVDRTELSSIGASVERAASGLHAIDLEPTRLITLPGRGPTRLVAVECDAPAELLELVRRLASRLAMTPRPDPRTGSCRT
jgi:2'-5' RNA ligase